MRTIIMLLMAILGLQQPALPPDESSVGRKKAIALELGRTPSR